MTKKRLELRRKINSLSSKEKKQLGTQTELATSGQSGPPGGLQWVVQCARGAAATADGWSHLIGGNV